MDIKAALKAEIEKMEAACDEIPFGLDEEDEQCLSVIRDALKELSQRDAQIAAIDSALCDMAGTMLNRTLDSGSKQAVAYAECADMVGKFARQLREGKA